MSIDDAKRALRAAATEQRREIAMMAGPDAGGMMADAFMAVLDDIGAGLDGDGVVSGYWPMAEEIDVRSLLIRLEAVKRPLALPVVMGAGQPLVFRRWKPGDLLDDGVFGTRHPTPANEEVSPRIVLAPLLAFDDRGGRIGWGAGYYDMTLARLRAKGPVVAVGVAFAGQQVAEVPMDETDERLDWVATEAGAFPLGGMAP